MPSDAELQKLVRNRLLATSFIRKSKNNAILNELRDQHLFQRDLYPTDLQSAYTLLKSHSSSKKQSSTSPDHDDNIIQGMQYAQRRQEIIAGTNGRSYPSIVCQTCQRHGHYSNYFPSDPKIAGIQHHMEAHAIDHPIDDDNGDNCESTHDVTDNINTESNSIMTMV